MHLISKLKASVGVLLTRTVPGLFLKQSGAPLHGKKTAKLLKVTVKKQTIVTEYVCCKRTNTRDPIHVKRAAFSFMHRNSARAHSCPCVPLKGCCIAEHQLVVAPNLKQLPYRMRQNCSVRKRYNGKTEAAENG